jgi:cytochrome c2
MGNGCRIGYIATVALTLGILAQIFPAATAIAQKKQPSAAETLFEKRCYSCHNIGGGDKAGPDLKGVTDRQSKEWLHRFIPSPSAMKSSGDPAAVAVFRKFAPTVMPDQSLTTEEIDALIAMLGEWSKGSAPFVPASARLARPIRAEDAGHGRQLFTGEIPLGNGAPACISCHNLDGIGTFGGGTLGPDLTAVNRRFGDPQLIAMLQNPAFPTMLSLFATKPLTEEEVITLFALFQQARAVAPLAGGGTTAAPIESGFLVAGAGGLIVAIVGFNLVWRRRLRGVREHLVQRARR